MAGPKTTAGFKMFRSCNVEPLFEKYGGRQSTMLSPLQDAANLVFQKRSMGLEEGCVPLNLDGQNTEMGLEEGCVPPNLDDQNTEMGLEEGCVPPNLDDQNTEMGLEEGCVPLNLDGQNTEKSSDFAVSAFLRSPLVEKVIPGFVADNKLNVDRLNSDNKPLLQSLMGVYKRFFSEELSRAYPVDFGLWDEDEQRVFCQQKEEELKNILKEFVVAAKAKKALGSVDDSALSEECFEKVSLGAFDYIKKHTLHMWECGTRHYLFSESEGQPSSTNGSSAMTINRFAGVLLSNSWKKKAVLSNELFRESKPNTEYFKALRGGARPDYNHLLNNHYFRNVLEKLETISAPKGAGIKTHGKSFRQVAKSLAVMRSVDLLMDGLRKKLADTIDAKPVDDDLLDDLMLAWDLCLSVMKDQMHHVLKTGFFSDWIKTLPKQTSKEGVASEEGLKYTLTHYFKGYSAVVSPLDSNSGVYEQYTNLTKNRDLKPSAGKEALENMLAFIGFQEVLYVSIQSQYQSQVDRARVDPSREDKSGLLTFIAHMVSGISSEGQSNKPLVDALKKVFDSEEDKFASLAKYDTSKEIRETLQNNAFFVNNAITAFLNKQQQTDEQGNPFKPDAYAKRRNRRKELNQQLLRKAREFFSNKEIDFAAATEERDLQVSVFLGAIKNRSDAERMYRDFKAFVDSLNKMTFINSENFQNESDQSDAKEVPAPSFGVETGGEEPSLWCWQGEEQSAVKERSWEYKENQNLSQWIKDFDEVDPNHQSWALFNNPDVLEKALSKKVKARESWESKWQKAQLGFKALKCIPKSNAVARAMCVLQIVDVLFKNRVWGYCHTKTRTGKAFVRQLKKDPELFDQLSDYAVSLQNKLKENYAARAHFPEFGKADKFNPKKAFQCSIKASVGRLYNWLSLMRKTEWVLEAVSKKTALDPKVIAREKRFFFSARNRNEAIHSTDLAERFAQPSSQ